VSKQDFEELLKEAVIMERQLMVRKSNLLGVQAPTDLGFEPSRNQAHARERLLALTEIINTLRADITRLEKAPAHPEKVPEVPPVLVPDRNGEPELDVVITLTRARALVDQAEGRLDTVIKERNLVINSTRDTRFAIRGPVGALGYNTLEECLKRLQWLEVVTEQYKLEILMMKRHYSEHDVERQIRQLAFRLRLRIN
jgi:hypothetical protein